ncbi:MAG TPA: hypothetical protein VNS60_06880 [Solirubrobacterales bacterium]|nr:hypothetical protein [Solirubrobacterales bacterium]
MLAGRLYRCLALLALVALVVLGAGCGGASTSTSTATSSASGNSSGEAEGTAVSEAEIDRYKEGTAQHTALEWWRTVQLNEAELARTLYAEPPSLPNLAGQFNYVVGQLDGSVKVVSVKTKGNHAVVAINWKKPGAAPREVTLQMERKNGEWKIATTLFLDLIVQKLQRAEASSG